jgi:hypothetical protein
MLALGFAFAGLTALNAQTPAKPKHPHKHPHVAGYVDTRPPLTVNRRSWLDPGPVAPVGSEQAYVTESTIFNQTPQEVYAPSRTHEDVMPEARPLYVPGSMTPLVEFATPGAPR